MSLAKVYAKALFEANAEGKAASEAVALCNQLDAQMVQVNEAVQSSKELQIALGAPITTSKEKAIIVQALAQKMGLNRLMTDFLVLLANKGRLILLPQIRDEFGSIRLLAEGGMPGVLVTAEPIAQSDVHHLTKSFSRKLGKKIAFQVKTDPSLLAGIKVTVNGVTYDGTLRSQLQQIRDRFLVGTSSGN